MAPESIVPTRKVENDSPYQLDRAQTLKASGALLKHIRTKSQQKDANSTTKNLLATDVTSRDAIPSDAESIWLVLSTKKFMTHQRSLKPRKVALPNSLNVSSDTSICLITPEPQRSFKDALDHPSFPTSLSRRISKVISVEKLEKKYHSFESKRQLRDTFDIFLADDRIITYLAKILGKTFYKTTPKRPIPVHLEDWKPRVKKNAALPSTKGPKEPSNPRSIASPPTLAKEIERTLSTAQIHLSPSTTTSVKVGLASFTPEQVAANIEAVIGGVTNKLIAWRNLRGIHVKGPNTMALPIWVADELWTDEGMILENDEAENARLEKAGKVEKGRKTIEAPLNNVPEASAQSKKRKGTDSGEKEPELRAKKAKKLEDTDFSREMKERREKLRQQKREAREQAEQENIIDAQPKAASRMKKRKSDMASETT